MNLHESQDIFLELIEKASSHYRIRAAYIEKDYWVTKALKRLAESEFADRLIFKGGTSLAKAHRLVRRFSEDIDLAAKRYDDAGNKHSGNQIKMLLRAAEKSMVVDLECQRNHRLESKHGTFRRTVHRYPSILDDVDQGPIQDILLEINAFTDPSPSEHLSISTLIGDMLVTEHRQDVVREYGLTPFEVDVLCVERTLCEKVMGLIRASYRVDSGRGLENRIRHIYDICMILRDERYRSFIASHEFNETMVLVQETDQSQFKKKSDLWVRWPLNEAPVITDPAGMWSSQKTQLHGDFRRMLYDEGDLPGDDEVLDALLELSERISALHL